MHNRMNSAFGGLCVALILFFLGISNCLASNGSYPRIANLWGAECTSKDYDQWSKYDMLIINGGATWKEFASELRSRNPHILLLGSTAFQSIFNPPENPAWMKDEWYLRDANGKIINWWVGTTWELNLIHDDALDAVVNLTEKGYRDLIRADSASGLMFDSVAPAHSFGLLDSNRDGIADDPEEIDSKWVQQQNVFFDKIHNSMPNALVIANDVLMSHAPHVNGRLFEGLRLLELIPTGYSSPQQAIHTLRGWMAGSRQPGVTFAIMGSPPGWGWWRLGTKGMTWDLVTPGELDRVHRDFPRMRLGLLTTVMSDAYYYYDFGTVWYGHHYWFAEYDAPLGQPLGDMKEVFTSKTTTVLDWRPGQSTSSLSFLANVKTDSSGLEFGADTDKMEYVPIFRTDPSRVQFRRGKTYRIAADFQVLHRSKEYFQLILRTPKGGEDHDKGWMQSIAETGEPWHAEATVTLDDFDDYRLELNQKGGGALRLTGLRIFEMKDSYLMRKFQGGTAILNPMPHPLTIKLDQPMRRLKDDAAPRYVTDIDDILPEATDKNWESFLHKYRDTTGLTIKSEFAADSDWEFKKQDGHQYGDAYRGSQKAGATASWKIVAPSTDTYTVFAWVMGGKDLTDSAVYTVAGSSAKATIDQRKYNGEWVKLFDVKLNKGKSCEVKLESSGKGTTVADAIRFESAARYNDGGVIKKVQLNALDGIILLNSESRKEAGK